MCLSALRCVNGRRTERKREKGERACMCEVGGIVCVRVVTRLPEYPGESRRDRERVRGFLLIGWDYACVRGAVRVSPQILKGFEKRIWEAGHRYKT